MTLHDVKALFNNGKKASVVFRTRSGRRYVVYWEQLDFLEDGDFPLGWATPIPRRGRKWHALNPVNLTVG